MKIIIDNDVEKYLTPDEYKYLLLLECHEGFEKSVLKLRDELGIPKKGIADQKLLNEKSWTLSQELNIPLRLHPSIVSIVEWGKVFIATHPVQVLGIKYQLNRKFLYNPELSPPPHKKASAASYEGWYLSNQYKLSTAGSIAPALPVIQINKRLTKKQLLKMVDDIWGEIDEAMDDFEKSVPFPTQITHISLKDIQKNIKIFLSRKQGTESLKIAQELVEEDQTIRKRYSDFKQMLLELGFIKR